VFSTSHSGRACCTGPSPCTSSGARTRGERIRRSDHVRGAHARGPRNDFIARHTTKFDPLREIISRYTPDVVETLCGIPRPQLEQAGEWIGASKSTMKTCLQGVYQSNQAAAAACGGPRQRDRLE